MSSNFFLVNLFLKNIQIEKILIDLKRTKQFEYNQNYYLFYKLCHKVIIILRTMMIDRFKNISRFDMFQLRKKKKKRSDLPLFKNQLRKAPTTNNNKK